MSTLLSIDPGHESGICLMGYAADEPMRIDRREQSVGGMVALLAALDSFPEVDEITVERFTPRPTARSYRLRELEPLRIEGALYMKFGDRIVWRDPEQRKLVNTLAGTRDFLRHSGYWSTGRGVGRPDSNDVNSATMHALGYLRDRGHRPTIDMLIDYSNTLTEEL